jgi:tRNA threonylcarbamoyladenosine biosynthesis protein TsaE
MNKNEEIFLTGSAEETKALGFALAKNLKNCDFIALYGNLGGGKTTFVQGLATGFGIKKRLISPTFIILRSYAINLQNLSVNMFYHLDLYRIQSEHDLQGIGIEEIIDDDKSVKVVEWAEKMKDFLPDKRIDIFFEYLAENKREIKIIKYGLSD